MWTFCAETNCIIFFCHGATAPVGQGRPIFRDKRSYSDTPQSVGLLRTSDNTQHSQNTNYQTSGGNWTHDPSMQAAADPRLRPRGHWKQQFLILATLWSERESQQDATVRCLFLTISQHVSGIIMPIFRRTKTVCYCKWCAALVLLDVVGSGCGALPCGVWALWRLLYFICALSVHWTMKCSINWDYLMPNDSVVHNIFTNFFTSSE